MEKGKYNILNFKLYYIIQGVINVTDKERVFGIVKDILTSEDSKMEQYFTISVNPEDILIRLKDNAWTKKEEIFLLFSFI